MTLAILFSLVASTAAADDSNLASRSSSRPARRPPENITAQDTEFQARSRLERAPQGELGIEPSLLEAWYEERFLWDPARSEIGDYCAEGGCLSQVAKKEWTRPARRGLYRYLRKRAVHYFKRQYRSQYKRDWRINPSFSNEDYESAYQAWHKGKFLQALRDMRPRIGGVAGPGTPEQAAPDPYVARLGPFRIDEDYRLELDVNDLWAAEAPEYDTVPGLATPARTLRKAPKRRLLAVKVSPRVNVRVGRGFEAQDLLSNYGAKVKLEILPSKDDGPLFSSSVRFKMTPDGRSQLTINVIEKRF